MDGMLSQDEINALLSGMDLSGGQDAAAPEDTAGTEVPEVDESLLTADEKDAIGEIANISMGSSATTLYSLVNRKVNITTPTVSLANWQGVVGDYEKPCVFIQIRYTAGLDGSNIMVLKEHDVKVITDLMMGGDGSNTEGELGELHLSAISEAMNQMMGAAATSMSTMLDKMIDISPPEANLVNLNEFKKAGDIASFLEGTFVKISFRMQIDDLVDSTIMQLYPIDFARTLYDTFIGSQMTDSVPEPEPEPYIPPTVDSQAASQGMSQMGGMSGMPQMNVQPAQFQNFNSDMNVMAGQENIGLIRDVPLEVTVELGRTKKSIAEILDFAPGTIIELDKIAGEPIDVLVNGKFVAKGEVVVIEESFGIRVTEIIK
ncbi:MAG: flagellar motor switch phosphatase FliY [Bacillota bacterium]|nr:flagellar motor switch phosphatase FliY [Bacillota bacterium]